MFFNHDIGLYLAFIVHFEKSVKEPDKDRGDCLLITV